MPVPNPDYYKKYSSECKIYVESGTYMGGSLDIALNSGLFEEYHSIEVSPIFYEMAVAKYKNDPRVKLWLGYSPDVLRESIIPNLKSRTSFWLDGHPCGDQRTQEHKKYGNCPLIQEVAAIKESKINNHTIFMDDRRLFGTELFDNLTEEEYRNKILEINSNYKFEHLDGGSGHLPDDIVVAYIE